MRRIIKYNPKLVAIARDLRKNMTLGEIILWKAIKGKQLGVRFSRQIPIDNFIVDFYCKDLRLAIEVDGPIHNIEIQKRRDLIRQHRLEKLGVHIIRFSNAEVKSNLGKVLEELRNIVSELYPTPDPSQEGKHSDPFELDYTRYKTDNDS